MRSVLKNKKGALEAIGGLQTLAVMGLVVGIILGLTFYVLGQFRDEIGDKSSLAYEGVNKTIEAIYKIPTFLGIIFLVGIIGVILMIVFAVIPAVRQPGAF